MEEDEGLIYKTVAWTMSHRRGVIVIGVLLVVLMLFMYIFSNYALINIEVISSSKPNNISIYTGSDSSSGTLDRIGGSGIVILPRSTKSIVVANDDYVKTRVNLQIPWYGVFSKKVSLNKDKNAEKIAYRSTTASTCALYRPKSDVLAFYNCRNVNAGLFKYNAPSSGFWSLNKISPITYPINYPEAGNHFGLISSSDNSANGSVVSINERNRYTIYNAPPIVDRDDQTRVKTDTSIPSITKARIYTDNSSTDNDRFAVTTRKGDIYIGTPTDGRNVSYHFIAAPDGYNSTYNQTLCSMNSNFVYCYRGPAVIGDVSTSFDFNQVTHSQIVVYSFASKSEKTFNVSSNLYTLDDIYVTSKGDLFGKRFSELLHFIKSGDIYNASTVSQNISTAAASDKLYYVNKNGVYVVDEDDATIAYQLFYSPNVMPKVIYPVDGKVFIIGSTPFDSSTTYAYQLTLDDNNSPGSRLIDLLPSKSDIPSMVSNDIVGDRVIVRLNVPMQSTSPSDIAAMKNEVVRYFDRQSYPIDTNKINFVY